MIVAPPGGHPAGQPLVLVADDEAGVRTMVAAALRTQGYDAVLCADGQAALDAVEGGGDFQCALVDIRMPRLDGLSLVRELRASERGRSLPVVVMSAYNDEQQEREAREAGADGFLPKPFTLDQLGSTLDRAIARPA